jgi:hypothetical protein
LGKKPESSLVYSKTKICKQISEIPTQKNHPKIPSTYTHIFNNSGIYQLKCKDCTLKYVGQTGRTFRARSKEHLPAIKTNKPNSRYVQHILKTHHTYDTINETMNFSTSKRKATY